MKIAVLNDTHCGIRNSSEIFLKNAADFYENIFFPECEKQGIEQILHLGDYYDHRKFVNFKALNHNRKHFLNELRNRGMKMDIIPGNHDTFYKNTNESMNRRRMPKTWCKKKAILQKFGKLVSGLRFPSPDTYYHGIMSEQFAKIAHSLISAIDGC